VSEGEGALASLRVLDLSQSVAGAFCTKLLSDFGADVVKVEPPQIGDVVRSVGPFKDDVPDPETGALFLHLNTGKRSVTLNIETSAGQELLLRLTADCDVLVDTSHPGVLEALGLGYQRFHERSPQLVIVAITPFGQDGPYRDFAASELVTYALGGRLYETGEPDQRPIKPYGYQAENRAGIQAATAVVAALFNPHSPTSGQFIDVSVMESIIPLIGHNIFFRRDELRLRAGVRTPWAEPAARYPTTVLPCADGYVHVHGHPTDRRALAAFVGEPRLLEPHLLQEPRGHADEIDALLLPWLAQATRDDLFESAQSAGFPFTKVLEIDEVLADPQIIARGAFVEVDHPNAGPTKQPGAPFRLTDSPAELRPAPRLGAHNKDVYGGWLGLNQAELTRLREQGVI
jgi:crotonobetainyl-CoA:carnitine CoA-transferase CaiB-like acyl-CoA transferase